MATQIDNFQLKTCDIVIFYSVKLCEIAILNDTSNATEIVFSIFSKLCKIFKRKCQGSEKNI